MIYRFGVFEFDSETSELRKNGRVVALERQPAKALALLLARAGDVVGRDELRDAVWGKDTHVDFDRGLAYCLSQIRTALGDSGENPRFVQTVPKRGVKFIAPLTPVTAPAPIAANTILPNAIHRPKGLWRYELAVGVAILLGFGGVWAFSRLGSQASPPVYIAVSIFDNETGLAQHDRFVEGLSDLVVTRLTPLAPDRIGVIGNASILRQPRNIRNLKALADALPVDYVLLGQFQRDGNGFRFITHFIRLRDQAHLRANRLTVAADGVAGLEAMVLEEFERGVREHVLNRPAN